MSNIIFSSWQGKVVDNRSLSADKYKKVGNVELPTECDGHKIRAFMGWDGVVVMDGKVNMVDVAHSYLREAQKVSCGECSVGYLGLKVMVDILARILDGKGKEEDIDLLQWLGEGIKQDAKCIFGRAMPTPVLDTLKYFKDDYLSLIKNPKKASRSNYVSKITAPCMAACPAHQDVPGYIDLIKNLRYEDSLNLIRKTNTLPGFCGRACVAFCEDKCIRANIDSAVAIRALKRFSADYEAASGLMPKLAKAGDSKQKIAVVGAGPAGLAASSNLALMGYAVTIYDEQPLAGGMAAAGIPSYRLPRETIKREVESIKRLGVKFKLNTKVGKDVTLSKLSDEGFKAVFIATGAHIGRELGVEADDSDYEGLVDGVDFLRSVNGGKKVEPKNKMIVIGGGNVAVDCARTCLRLGFKDVMIVYRRSRDEMPGRKEEVEAAEKEGVKITFLATPVKILTKNGKVTGTECIRMKLGEPDESGRRRPLPIPDSEFKIETDLIIPAVGEKPDLSFLTGKNSIKTTEQGTIEIDPYSYQTSRVGVFSGGDCVTGPATLVEAIAAGNKAARSIDQYLRTGNTDQAGEQIIEEISHKVDLVSDGDEVLRAKKLRQSPEQLPVSSRVQGFDEVEKVFTPEAALAEAERCLRCYRLMLLATD